MSAPILKADTDLRFFWSDIMLKCLSLRLETPPPVKVCETKPLVFMIKSPLFSPIAGIFLVLVLFSSCSQYQRLLKSDDYELKYQRALEYFEDGEYSRAIGLLSSIIPIYRGTAEAQTINYYFALAHFHNREYTLASHYFKSYVNAFPRSEHAEEFLYLSAYCQYLESPRYSLDQSSTRQAIRELQAFINRYPQSDRVADANELIDELRFKLEKKRFETGRLYLNISDYVAAATTFETMNKDFPDSQFREEAMYLTVKAYYEYAYNSIPQRQEERYGDVVSAFRALERRYPDSDFLPPARDMKERAEQVIARFREASPENQTELTGSNQ